MKVHELVECGIQSEEREMWALMRYAHLHYQMKDLQS